MLILFLKHASTVNLTDKGYQRYIYWQTKVIKDAYIGSLALIVNIVRNDINPRQHRSLWMSIIMKKQCQSSMPSSNEEDKEEEEEEKNI